MPRRKSTEVKPKNVMYRVTCKSGDHMVALKNHTVYFDKNHQAIVTKEQMNTLKEMGVI